MAVDWIFALAAFHGARTAVVAKISSTSRPNEPVYDSTNLAEYWSPAEVHGFWLRALAQAGLSEADARGLAELGIAARLDRLRRELAVARPGPRRDIIERLQVSETSTDAMPAELFQWLDACLTMPDLVAQALEDGRRRRERVEA